MFEIKVPIESGPFHSEQHRSIDDSLHLELDKGHKKAFKALQDRLSNEEARLQKIDPRKVHSILKKNMIASFNSSAPDTKPLEVRLSDSIL